LSSLKDFQRKVGSLLGLLEEDLKDFHEAYDHPKECMCDKCKKWHLIMKGKYKS
jgi:hypothetical protein